MNCRSEVLELSVEASQVEEAMLAVEASQVEEAMLAVLHTVLLHRCTGRFRYNPDGTYCVGTLGTSCDVDCDSLDFTFVRASCDRLHALLRAAVSEFRAGWSGCVGTGQMSLEFYQRKKGRWPLADDGVPWEAWSVRATLVDRTRQGRRSCGRDAGERLAERLMDVAQVMNRHGYLPATPARAQIDQVFDTGLTEVQPYLYRITQHHVARSVTQSVGTTVRRLIRDTLAL